MGLHLAARAVDTWLVEHFGEHQVAVDTSTSASTRRDNLVIDLNHGTVAAGAWRASFEPGPSDADEVLTRYLALVYEMRALEPGTTISLRTLDVSVLATALAMPPMAVEDRLVVLMEPGNRRLATLRARLGKRVFLPAAGIVVAATAVGVLVMMPGSDAAPGNDLGKAVAGVASESTTEVAPGPVQSEIGEAITIERPAVAPAVMVADDAVEVAPGPVPSEIGEGLTIER